MNAAQLGRHTFVLQPLRICRSFDVVIFRIRFSIFYVRECMCIRMILCDFYLSALSDAAVLNFIRQIIYHTQTHTCTLYVRAYTQVCSRLNASVSHFDT